MTRVVSLPSSNTICIDLGYKAIASENPLENRVYFLNAPSLNPIGHSEEHMVLDAGESHTFKTGDVLYALPVHICPTIALYGKLSVVKNGAVVDEWEVAARKR
jgi:D-serine deaminase-like pyridoxal phosphate-dependent protein